MEELFNVTYDKHPFKTIYGRVNHHQLILASTKKEFKAFVFDANPTRIAMVTVVDGEVIIGKYNS